MYVRRFSLAFVSGLVGYGAWYAYRGTPDQQLARNFISTSTPPSGATVDVAAAAVPTRQVLVIGADELHTGTFVGEGPISKETSDDGRRIVEIMSPEQATEQIRRMEESYLVNRGQGVVRYDLVQLASNDPIEDDHAEKIVEVPDRSAAGQASENSDWMFWGVFDGHAGWTTSAKLRQTLINFVARELNSTYKAAGAGQSPAAEAIDAAIKAGFVRLDNEIVHESAEKVLRAGSKTMAAEMLAPALSGSCALLSFYDARTRTLRVACTGDSRAVLGRRSPHTGKWTAVALSADQTGSTPDEAARLRRQHPGEEHVVRNGRVLGGLEPTRAFGDASYKWSRDVSERLKRHFFGRTPSPLLRTPPYVTAEPVVTTTRVEPEKGDFVVMASDGLWEMLTNEEVVGLVGKWIETQAAAGKGQGTVASKGTGSGAPSAFEAVWSRIFGSSAGAGALPVEAAAKGAGDAPEGARQPIRQQQWGIGDQKERFVVRDNNVATHLVRNALGGRNEEQVCALLTLPSPYSRRYRDDLTVEVIFFGNGEKTGQVVVNEEATAPSKRPIKAKL